MVLTRPSSRHFLGSPGWGLAGSKPLKCTQTLKASHQKVQHEHACALRSFQQRSRSCCTKVWHSCKSSQVSAPRHWYDCLLRVAGFAVQPDSSMQTLHCNQLLSLPQVSCLIELVQHGPAMAHHLWVLLFPIVWSSLLKEQQVGGNRASYICFSCLCFPCNASIMLTTCPNLWFVSSPLAHVHCRQRWPSLSFSYWPRSTTHARQCPCAQQWDKHCWRASAKASHSPRSLPR